MHIKYGIISVLRGINGQHFAVNQFALTFAGIDDIIMRMIKNYMTKKKTAYRFECG